MFLIAYYYEELVYVYDLAIDFILNLFANTIMY